MKERASDSAAEKESTSSVRLVFHYEGAKVKLINQKRVEIIAPPSDPLIPEKGAAGFWCELRDRKNRTLYRRVKQNPIKYRIEIATGDPREPLRWEKCKEVRGEFTFVVPEMASAETLLLFSSPLSLEKEAAPARELASFNLEISKEG